MIDRLDKELPDVDIFRHYLLLRSKELILDYLQGSPCKKKSAEYMAKAKLPDYRLKKIIQQKFGYETDNTKIAGSQKPFGL